MEPKIIHLREIDKKLIGDRNPRGISNFGGATIAYSAQDGGLVVAICRCHPKDNFRKEYGRKTALHRYRNGVTETIICHEVETIRGCIQRWYDETYKMGWNRGAS